jgi:hypothetical protein
LDNIMRLRFLFLLAAVLVSVGCSRHEPDPHPLSPEQRAAVESNVRSFMLSVAHEVTSEGPTAWQKEFADDPAFFMAVDGHLAFPDRQSATKGIQNLPSLIKRIELRWGDDLRVDVLTENLAVVAASYSEVQTDPGGHQITENGFFTGVAELVNGRWQFRDAHWSDPVPPPPRPE